MVNYAKNLYLGIFIFIFSNLWSTAMMLEMWVFESFLAKTAIRVEFQANFLPANAKHFTLEFTPSGCPLGSLCRMHLELVFCLSWNCKSLLHCRNSFGPLFDDVGHPKGGGWLFHFCAFQKELVTTSVQHPGEGKNKNEGAGGVCMRKPFIY